MKSNSRSPSTHIKSTSESPCIKVCVIENDMCIGCFRTLNEIAGWSTYSDQQKHEVNEQLEGRIDGIFGS